MTGRAAQQRKRAHRALLVAWLWLGTIIGLPAVHEARHDESAPHTHLGDGSIVQHASTADHDGDDRRQHRTDDDGAAGPMLQAVAAPHLTAGLAHHAMAIRGAAPPITSPLPIDRRPTFAVAALSPDPVERQACTPSARGPPWLG